MSWETFRRPMSRCAATLRTAPVHALTGCRALVPHKIQLDPSAESLVLSLPHRDLDRQGIERRQGFIPRFPRQPPILSGPHRREDCGYPGTQVRKRRNRAIDLSFTDLDVGCGSSRLRARHRVHLQRPPSHRPLPYHPLQPYPRTPFRPRRSRLLELLASRA